MIAHLITAWGSITEKNDLWSLTINKIEILTYCTLIAFEMPSQIALYSFLAK